MKPAATILLKDCQELLAEKEASHRATRKAEREAQEKEDARAERLHILQLRAWQALAGLLATIAGGLAGYSLH